MIGKTILTPANFTNQGPRFQYVHNQVIKVKKGDYLGTYSTVQGCYNVISARESNVKKARGWKRIEDDGLFGGDKQVSASDFKEEKRHLALRAFVAGVLFYLCYCMRKANTP